MKTDRIKGHTLRWTFDDGPTAGKTFEHTFAENGMVTYRMLGGEKGGKGTTEKHYEALELREGVYVVSYLASSGYTLTTVLDFKSGTMIGVASNEETLVVQRGTFEAVKRAA